MNFSDRTKVPKWIHALLASNDREKDRIRRELGKFKGGLAVLMKPRNGGEWTQQDRAHLKGMIRGASAVYPYLIIWVLPGSMVLLPFLAWHLDVRRQSRKRLKVSEP